MVWLLLVCVVVLLFVLGGCSLRSGLAGALLVGGVCLLLWLVALIVL